MRIALFLTLVATLATPARPADVPSAGATATPAATAESTAARQWLVVSVHDGDTVSCLDDEKSQHKVRIVGIDAPEIGQPFGTASRDALRGLVLRKTVTVAAGEKDRFGRTLGSLTIDGDDVARRMVADGMAWHFTRYSDDESLATAERDARTAQRGLWADRDPMPPWEWRATERERKKPRPRSPR